MNVWIVGIRDADGDNKYYACLSKETALKRWEELRLECIKDVKKMLQSNLSNSEIEMYTRMMDKLSETDPNKMYAYPHEEPYINCMELEE